MRVRSAGAMSIVAAAALAAAGVTGTGDAGSDPSVRPSTGSAQIQNGLTLRLVDQRWAIAPGEPLQLEYVVEGEIAGVVPPTTTTTSTSTTTTEPRRTTTTRPRPATATATTQTVTTTPSETEAVAPPPAPVDDVPVADLVVAVHRPIVGQVALAQALDVIPPDIVDVVRMPLADVLTPEANAPPGAPTPMRITVPTTVAALDDDSLTMGGAGLVPVSVYVHVDGELVASHSTIVQRTDDPDSAPTIDVAMLAGIAPAGPRPDADQVAAGHDDLEAMAELGEAVDAPLSLSIPPSIAAAVADDDPALGERLRSALAGDEAISLPAYELDPSSVVPVNAAALIDRVADGEDMLDELLPSTPALRSAWIVDRPLGQRAAQVLRDLGFRLLVIDDDVYASLPGNIGGFTDTTLVIETTIGDEARLPALVTTPWASLLDPQRPVDDTRSPADRAVRVIAELLALRADFDPTTRRAAVLSTPDLTVPDPAVLAALADFVDESPDVRAVTLSALPGATSTMDVAGEPVTVELPATAGSDLTVRADAIARTRFAAADVGSMLDPDDPRPETWSARLDTLLSTALTDADAVAALSRIDEQVEELRAAVVQPESFTFTLTGRSDELRLRIRNDADVPLQIVVRAVSPKLTFPAADQQVTLAAGELTNIELPVRARSNGTSSVAVELTTPAGGALGPPIILTVHVTALTGLGQVITGGAVLMLLTWWGSHVRRNRLRRRAVNGDASDTDDDTDTDTDADTDTDTDTDTDADTDTDTDTDTDMATISPDAAEASAPHSPHQ